MTDSFHYSTTYKLDKSHFSETYEESTLTLSTRPGYIKAAILTFVGVVIMLFTAISGYVAWFVIGLGVLEALSVRFNKAWWLARQMISRAAGNNVTLTISDEGIGVHSLHVNSKITWQAISELQQTSRGWLVFHSGGKSYISGRCLSEEAQQFLLARSTESAPAN